ncbi:hypothetical protein NDU88_001039 [Pleurodeles waltl]|uniref:ribonuclease H n=1 Tax=Pleurodeles waltl TaxID=8319 RepID=A0AAV7S7R1_PLEWA|nr:hypothetical protein NDU88_001039 [Pleurodeles waltl]
MAKTDIKSAFRLLPVHPDDFSLLGIQFGGHWYVDKALPMGCSTSCALFECFSTFLQWIFVRVSGHRAVTHYLDDFFFVGPQATDLCAVALRRFQELMEDLDVPLAPEKTVGPCTALTFLGIELDTITMVARLPSEKKEVMLRTLMAVLRSKKPTVRDIQVQRGLGRIRNVTTEKGDRADNISREKGSEEQDK